MKSSLLSSSCVSSHTETVGTKSLPHKTESSPVFGNQKISSKNLLGKKKTKAFTLVELIVVITILAIL